MAIISTSYQQPQDFFMILFKITEIQDAMFMLIFILNKLLGIKNINKQNITISLKVYQELLSFHKGYRPTGDPPDLP